MNIPTSSEVNDQVGNSDNDILVDRNDERRYLGMSNILDWIGNVSSEVYICLTTSESYFYYYVCFAFVKTNKTCCCIRSNRRI